MTDFTRAWLVALLPRAIMVLAAWPDVRLTTSYTNFEAGLFETDLYSAFWPPLYGALAWGLWALSFHYLLPFALLHAAVHALVSPLVLMLGIWLGIERRTAWIGALAAAFLPYYVATAVSQLDVGIVITLAAAVMAAFAAWCRGEAPRRAAAVTFAVLAFLLFLIRPNAIALIAALYLAASLKRPRVAGLVLSVTVFAGLTLAWSTKSWVAFGHFTPLPANAGYNLYLGNNPQTGAYLTRRESNYSEMWEHAREPELAAMDHGYDHDVDEVTAAIAWRYMRAHPRETITAAFRKAGRYWDYMLSEASPHSRLQRIAYTVPYLIYLPLAVLGAVRLWRRGSRWAVVALAGAIIAYMLPHLVVFGMIRMRMTLEFALLILAAAALPPPRLRTR